MQDELDDGHREPSPDTSIAGSSVSEAQQRRQQEQTGDSGDTETEDTLSHLHISPAPADSALLTSDLSAAEPQPSSPPATSSASPSSSLSSSSHSPSASPCSSPPPPPAKRAKRLTKAQQDAELLALIDPIYLGQPVPSPRSAKPATASAAVSSSPAKHVTFHTVKVLRFPLTADASKVPGNSASYWSVGLDYDRGGEGEELEVDAWERRRGRERKKGGCPEVSPEARREVWLEAQGRLKEEAEDDHGDGDRQLQPTAEADDADDMREEEQEEEQREGAEDDAMQDAAAVSPVDAEEERKEGSDDAQLPSSHTHNLRARSLNAVPPSPSSLSSAASSAAASAPPLLFSDVSDLTSLRSSRAKVGCSCHVAAGDRVTKICSAPWLLLDSSRRNRRKRKEEVDDDDDDDVLAPLHADDGADLHDDAEEAEAETEAADTEAAEERKEGDAEPQPAPSLSEVECECLRAGVGCNSNTCSCFSYCCRNPHSRYLFNAGKVNAKRKRMVQRMREIRLQQSRDKEKKRQQKQQTAPAEQTDAGSSGSSKSMTSSAKRRESRRKARDRAQTA